jgi:hypothetical protein
MPRSVEVRKKWDAAEDQKEEKDWIQLENMSEFPQDVYDDTGRKWTLAEFAVEDVPERIAQLFLEKRAQFVRVFEPLAIPPRPGQATVWVANMTGNPFNKAEVQVERKVHGELVEHTVPNPNLIPRILEFEIRRDQDQEMGQDGQVNYINHPAQKLRLPPFQRHPVPASIAMWVCNRDSYQDAAHVGKVARCRGPSAGDPNMTWNYDVLRVYAHLIDSKHFDIIQTYPPAEKMTDADALHKHKQSLLRRLFFRIIDERFTPVPRAALRRGCAEILGGDYAKDGELAGVESVEHGSSEPEEFQQLTPE